MNTILPKNAHNTDEKRKPKWNTPPTLMMSPTISVHIAHINPHNGPKTKPHENNNHWPRANEKWI
ncbi:hypothetical protein [Spiroplasma endosymbiont of Aspidapion aeneum]|uniref:hypothetical protein n=1 Tax=Spiroplasma endosymbiont of Aspidapion aeneum TaxID=3066276 RepID=UPI00313B102F